MFLVSFTSKYSKFVSLSKLRRRSEMRSESLENPNEGCCWARIFQSQRKKSQRHQTLVFGVVTRIEKSQRNIVGVGIRMDIRIGLIIIIIIIIIDTHKYTGSILRRNTVIPESTSSKSSATSIYCQYFSDLVLPVFFELPVFTCSLFINFNK